MICTRAKLEFALFVAMAYWLVADVRLVSPVHLLVAGAILIAAAVATHTLVRPLYGAHRICTPL